MFHCELISCELDIPQSEAAHEPKSIRARGEGGLPPKRDVNLFNLRAGGRGVYGDVAAQGLFPGSASVYLYVCLSALVLVGGRGANFGVRTRSNDSGERGLQKVKDK